ncbi:MAG: reductive dehalogenase [Candidatus Bathyarchaeota archaeon]|nr:reductive dehalogenase [Candidatus Bathyarchaeota archaeon]
MVKSHKPTQNIRHNPTPFITDPTLDRFDPRNIVFNRIQWDTTWPGYKKFYDEHVTEIISQEKPGYSRIDYALAYASWIVHDAFGGGFAWDKISLQRTPAASAGLDWTESPQVIHNPAEMSSILKQAAHRVGAAMIGICKLDKKWLYAGVQIPDDIRYAVVLAVEMDAGGIAASPAVPAAIATGIGYSKMAFMLAILGEFIRNLGYRALQCGNDTALSIPLAIEAGLGELGRNGLLITPHLGSRVRLCKILTNLPLALDRPISFGVTEFCTACKLCAQHCETDAISMNDAPSFTTTCKSNNPGAHKWYVNAEKCYLYWHENSIDCSTCIKVCPYTPNPAEKTNIFP